MQDRASRILQAIWEPEFSECSFGFRPGRSAHQALARLNQIIKVERTQWLVEADIKSFFDRVDHEWLMRFVAYRVGDSNLLRLIRRFLKAGVLEDGAYRVTEQGTPQGGLISPVLANIYLHYVLDVWFERGFARQCQGEAYLVRYADDFVACFKYEADAKRFQEQLAKRLTRFGLEVEPAKTSLLRFGDMAPVLCKREGLRRPATFDFLGFTHYAAKSRGGRFVLGRKTQRERVRKKLKALRLRLVALRVQGVRVMQDYVRQHLTGHIHYYGVTGNTRSLRQYVYRVRLLLFKWLNRRSQRRSLTWVRYGQWVDQWFPRPRILHSLRV